MSNSSKRRLVITAVLAEPSTSPRSPAPTACSQGWISKPDGPLRGRRRGGFRAPLPALRRPPRARPPPADRRPDPAAPQGAVRGRPGRRRRHHRLAPDPPPPASRVSRATINRHPGPRRAGHPGPAKRPEELLHPVRSRASPTRPGNPTSPTTGSPAPTAAPAPTWRSSPGSTTTPATPCTSPHTRRITAPIVNATFRETAGQHGIPASTLTDNGMVYTVRFAGIGRQGGRNGFEARTARAGTSSRRTPDPTTPPPAARSNASSRR